MTKKKDLVELEILQNDKNTPSLEEVDDAIQASKEEPPPVIPPVVKPKRTISVPKSAKQMEVFALTRLKLVEANRLRKEATDAKLNAKKVEKEERIVKTAIVIKKKQIKREAILDNVSDGEDDEPVVPVRKSAMKRVRIQEQYVEPAPLFIFR